jgi:GT2 family glycosyltransferase
MKYDDATRSVVGVGSAARNDASSGGLSFKISVVVPTFNRCESLRGLLESIRRQTLSSTQFQVIVVSDGSSDGTVEMVREWQTRWGNLELLELENRGPAAARNAGARAARGCYLAFTDDDCLASESWLEQLLLAFERTGAVAVQGRTTTDRLARSPLTHQMEVLSSWIAAMPTCNAAYLKSAFDSVGGFDESFRFAHNEDADLAWRVEELGKIVFAPEVHIIHPPRRDRFLKRARWVRGLESDFLLNYKNPEKYRRYVSFSPWWTIYWKIFIVGQVRLAKSCCRYLVKPFRPENCLLGLCLVVARWFYLVRFFPQYLKAQAFYRSRVPANDGKAPLNSAVE